MSADEAATALVFDFGGPVLRLPFELLDVVRERSGLAADRLDWAGPWSADRDPLWHEVLHGDVSERVYWSTRAGEISDLLAEPTHGAFFDFLYATVSLAEAVRPEAYELLDRARAAGLRTGVLTNDIAAFRPQWYDEVAFLSQVDEIVDGSLTGILKPDPRAYAAILDLLGADAADTVFVDDLPRNVRGAHELGLRAVWFDITDVAGSMRRIDAALGGLTAVGSPRTREG